MADVIKQNEQRFRGAPIRTVWLLLVLAWGAFLLPHAGTGVLIGWPLNLVAFCLAIVVIARGRTVTGVVQLAASVVVSPLIYLLGLALFMAVSAFDDVDIDIHTLPPSPQHERPAPRPATPELQMTTLPPAPTYRV